MKEESEESFQVLLTEFFNQTLQVHCEAKPFFVFFVCRYSVLFFCLWNFFITSQMLSWSPRQTTAWAHYQRHCSKPQLKIECVRVWNPSRIIVSPRVQAVFKGGGDQRCIVNLEVWPLPAQEGGYMQDKWQKKRKMGRSIFVRLL
jgi:hypothetical protein